eukprot:6121504-Pyramimonas_sp.AAC.1
MQAQLNLQDPKEDPKHKDDMDFIDVVYKAVKKCLSTVAGATILTQKAGAAQVAESIKFLARPNLDVPNALRTELERVSKATGKAAAAKSSAAPLAPVKPEQ